MCRSAEAWSSQLEAMSAQNSHAHSPSEVNFVKKPSKGAGKSSFVKDCRIGGQAHEKEGPKCLAFGTICSACQKENHFALKCAPSQKKPGKTKKPRHRNPPLKHSVNQFDFDESGEEILSVSCYEEKINTIDNPSNKILTTVKIGGKNLNSKCLLIQVHPAMFCPSNISPKELWWRNRVTPSICIQRQSCQPLVNQKSP